MPASTGPATPWRVAALLALLLAPPGPLPPTAAHAEDAVAVLSWQALDAASADAWSRGDGAAWRARSDGARAAARAVAPPLTELTLSVAPDTRPGQPVVDDNWQAQLGFSLGDRRGAAVRLWRAVAASLDASARADALAFRDAARQAWLGAWVPAAFAHHLEAHAAELAADLDPLRRAAERGVLSAAEVDDLAVELGRLRAEAAAFASRAEAAEVHLSALIGRHVHVDPDALGDLEASLPPARNPWAAVADALAADPAAHPDVAAATARVRAVEAESERARREPVATLGAGLLLRTGVSGAGQLRVTPGPLLTLSIPLSNPAADDARALRGEVAAAEAAAGRARDVTLAAVRAEAETLEAAASRLQAMLRDVEAPMQARVERLEAGLDLGAASARDLILARRDLHEAFHARALAAADLLARRARGEALAEALGLTSPPAEEAP